MTQNEYWRTAEEMYSLDNGDYPDVDDAQIEFPAEIGIAYAVCGKACGRAEFIVDGSTQICQYCGGMMFRTAVRKYALTPEPIEKS